MQVPVSDLLLLLPEPPDMGVWLAAFHIYVDESGKLSGKTDYTALCGYVAHVQEWNRVSLEWNTCLFKWQVPPVHMSRIMSPDSKDDGWKAKKAEWGKLWESKRDQLLDELAMIIQRSSCICVGALVDANAYRKILTEPKHTLHYEDSNVFAFHYVLMTSLKRIETVDKFSPVAVVLDDDPENAKSYYDNLTTLRTHPDEQFKKVNERLHAISFCNDASYPGLQAADMIAFVSRKLKLDKIDKQNDEDIDIDTVPYSLYPQLTLGGVHQPRVYTEELIRRVARGTYQRMNGEDVTDGEL